MKKILINFLTAALVLCCLSTVSAQRFGLKAGANLANWGGDAEGTKMLFSFQIGGVAEFPIGESGLGFGTGLQLHGKGAKAEEGDGKAAPYYLQVPLNLQYRRNGLFLAGGPYAGFGLFGNFDDGTDSESISFGSGADDDLSALDFGVGFEVGYEFTGNLRATASYNLGLANIIPKDQADAFDISIKNNVIGIALAYLFGE